MTDKDKLIAELKAENASLYKEKDCLHKIIDRLLENSGYSKDIASAEDFEDVYENMQYKNNKLEEYKQTLQEIKAIAETCISKDACFECKYSDDCHIEDAEIPTYDICKLLIQKITKAEEE